jgi:hypothetical protein
LTAFGTLLGVSELPPRAIDTAGSHVTVLALTVGTR